MNAVVPDYAELVKALADETRLHLVALLAGQEACVCHLVEVLGQPQPTVSRHLAVLRRAGLVAARREGSWVHYRLAVPDHPGVARVFTTLTSELANDPAYASDAARLRARGACQ